MQLFYFSFFFLILNISKLPFYSDFSLDDWSRCKWSSNHDEPLLFVRFDDNNLNIVDFEKDVLSLKNPIKTDKSKYTMLFY